ncbi:hypothetical protein C8J57DRAFT_594170 [Mycena rebaudengoi]|nr:hypothetical protein C8J57DRAFT_594170 [Mycena rebaudengoi]
MPRCPTRCPTRCDLRGRRARHDTEADSHRQDTPPPLSPLLDNGDNTTWLPPLGDDEILELLAARRDRGEDTPTPPSPPALLSLPIDDAVSPATGTRQMRSITPNPLNRHTPARRRGTTHARRRRRVDPSPHGSTGPHSAWLCSDTDSLEVRAVEDPDTALSSDGQSNVVNLRKVSEQLTGKAVRPNGEGEEGGDTATAGTRTRTPAETHGLLRLPHRSRRLFQPRHRPLPHVVNWRMPLNWAEGAANTADGVSTAVSMVQLGGAV